VTDGAAPTLAERYPKLDADFAGLLLTIRSTGVAPLHEVPVTEARERVAAGAARAIPGPADVEVVDHAVAGVAVRDYASPRRHTDTMIVWLHGGGWLTGDLDYLDSFCRILAGRLGVDVRSVDYRLAPEHRFPAAVEDALAVVRATAAERPVLVAGDSAGGNLAAVCARQLAGEPSMRGQLLVYPVLDTDVERDSYRRNVGLILGVGEMTYCFCQYAPDIADRASALVSPLRAPVPAALAPAVIAVAGHDPLHDEGADYAAALRAAGIAVEQPEFPSLVHGFLRYTAVVPAAAQAQERIVEATARMLGIEPGHTS
jgi:acetyl esterase